MSQLIVVQTKNNGVRKTWRLGHQKNRFIFGNSRSAQLQSIDTDCDRFEAVIENDTTNWFYLSFNNTQQVVTKIKNSLEISLPDSRLNFYFINKFDQYNEQLLRFKNLGAQSVDKILIKTLTAHSFKNVWSSEQSKYLKFVVIASFIMIGLPLLLFEKKPVQISQIPQTNDSVSIVVKNLVKKIKSSRTLTVVQNNTAASGTASSGGNSAVAQKIKNSLGARFSQLLGKVSVTEARNAQAIAVSQGLKATENQPTRSLSSVGSISKSGSNWAAHAAGANGQGGVSVNGLGGGGHLKALGGGLGQGKVGSAGVNLIEEESEVVGGLDREIIAQYIKTKLGQILYCYERQLSATPDLFGKINVKFTIAGTGNVETQLINDTTLKNRSVENCILGKISKWKFPEPRGGTKVVVTYPFLFKSTN